MTPPAPLMPKRCTGYGPTVGGRSPGKSGNHKCRGDGAASCVLAAALPRGPGSWYGASTAWRLPFERDAKRRHGENITTALDDSRLVYRTTLEVRGIIEPVPVTLAFFAWPPYPTYGLPAQDYPRVWVDAPAESPHRMPDKSLCLYNPADPPERRWTSDLGLLTLLDLTRDHLFFEHSWRHTGGWSGGVWPAPESPHGFPGRRLR